MSEQDVATFERFSYLVRPSKQVERKLLVEALSRLPKAGYAVREYHYVGLGSPFFADFVLFHKHLYVDRMTCAEIRPIPKRMDFNRPYEEGKVQIHMGPVNQVPEQLDRERRHLVWLDYDGEMDREVLNDIGLFLNVLAAGSVVIVTVPAQPPILAADTPQELIRQRQERLQLHYDEVLGLGYPNPPTPDDVTRPGMPNYFANVLRAHFRNELGRRQDGVTDFYQFFNFRYADGMQMLTVGGMIEAPGRSASIQSSGIYELGFVVADESKPPLEISVPPLTVREKLWLDRKLHSGLTTNDLEFELDEEPLENYRRYYRHYPVYVESLF